MLCLWVFVCLCLSWSTPAFISGPPSTFTSLSLEYIGGLQDVLKKTLAELLFSQRPLFWALVPPLGGPQDELGQAWDWRD